MTHTVTKEFFEQKYRTDRDPWNFEFSHYELNRYSEIIRSLNDKMFDSAFEPGCSIGVLTQRLGHLCNRLYAIDISPTAVASARQRCADQPHIQISEGRLPDDLPNQRFDLIVFSEIGYYFERRQLIQLRDQIIDILNMSGTLVAAHWLGISADHILHGEEVHEILGLGTDLRSRTSHRFEGFVLDTWERMP